jgi:mono/diheme cytochrome c family protein
MKYVPALTIAILAALIFILPAAQMPSTNQSVSRGKYLAEEIGRCWECHTPQSSPGQWDRMRWLQGADVWFQPIAPMINWAYRAPRIAGLPTFSDEAAHQILEKGIGPNGYALRLPMHSYHLSNEDAADVIAYLRSLKSPL